MSFRDAMLKMIPVLQAEDELRLVSATAAGAGNMKKADRASYLSGLRAQTKQGGERVRTTADLQRLGLQVETRTKKRKEATP